MILLNNYFYESFNILKLTFSKGGLVFESLIRRVLSEIISILEAHFS